MKRNIKNILLMFVVALTILSVPLFFIEFTKPFPYCNGHYTVTIIDGEKATLSRGLTYDERYGARVVGDIKLQPEDEVYIEHGELLSVSRPIDSSSKLVIFRWCGAYKALVITYHDDGTVTLIEL